MQIPLTTEQLKTIEKLCAKEMYYFRDANHSYPAIEEWIKDIKELKDYVSSSLKNECLLQRRIHVFLENKKGDLQFIGFTGTEDDNLKQLIIRYDDWMKD